MHWVNYYKKLGLAIIIWMCLGNTVLADLLITPTRVAFDERSRSASVHLVNTSNTTNTYRLSWEEKFQSPDGKYTPLTQEHQSFPVASSMIRFSPRQVVLAPGERQTVRLALRRGGGLKIGEYRSHLLFQKLPNVDDTLKENNQGSTFKLHLSLGFSIPVIVQQGKYDADIKISSVDILRTIKGAKNYYAARVNLRRSGHNSATGKVLVYWKGRINGEYKELGFLDNVAIYSENRNRFAIVDVESFQLDSGYLKIVFEGDKQFKKKIYSEFSLKLDTNKFIYVEM